MTITAQTAAGLLKSLQQALIFFLQSLSISPGHPCTGQNGHARARSPCNMRFQFFESPSVGIAHGDRFKNTAGDKVRLQRSRIGVLR